MKTLIVVDMQNDFIDGSLGTKEAQAIVQKKKRRPNCPRFLSIRFIMKNTKDYSFITSI